LKTEAEEIEEISKWLQEQVKGGLLAHEIGLFVRSESQLNRAEASAKKAGLKYKVLDSRLSTISGHISICTMPLAKGLEFRAIAIMACDDEVIPLQSRIESVGDDADLQEVYDTERHLLYVACTRARDNLIITGIEPVSEFLDDLGLGG
jgi:superfamily I DNA/RNA helicase